MSNRFDYIVVGAGSAGCAVANRLSFDKKKSVLLLEAGKSSHPLSRIPVSFALLASYLITIPGLLLVGALLLYWVCFKFYQDIKEFSKSDEENKEDVTEKVKGKSMKNALITITIADISMSLDNVIAVTAIARDQTYLLMFGIGFSILLIAIFASAIVRLLTKFKWLSYVGLVFLIYLSTEMAIDGYLQIKPYISF